MSQIKNVLWRTRQTASTKSRVTLLRLLALGRYDVSNTLVVSGCPRSGTTWMAGALSTVPGSSILFEPLHLEHVPSARRAGFTWRTYVRPGTDWPEGERFLERVLQGKVLNGWTTREITQVRPTKAWIVKFVRANRMLAWMTERFPVRRPVLLIRHPCAVVASQLDHGWAGLAKPPDEDILRFRPDLADFYRQLDTPEEFLATAWALDYGIPLREPKPHPWQLVCYEQVVGDPETQFRAIFRNWSMDVPNDLWSRIEAPSRTSNLGLGARSRPDLIADWRGRLDPGQVRRILDVVSAFGVDLYSDSPGPDEFRLREFVTP